MKLGRQMTLESHPHIVLSESNLRDLLERFEREGSAMIHKNDPEQGLMVVTVQSDAIHYKESE